MISQNSPYRISSTNAYLRQDPSYNAHIVSEGIYSEIVEVIPKENDSTSTQDWSYIQIQKDGYMGWLHNSHFGKSHDSFSPNATCVALQGAVYMTPTIKQGVFAWLPFESEVQITAEVDTEWCAIRLLCGRCVYIQNKDIQKIELDAITKNVSALALCLFARRFLELPYIWGGRSSRGYDCSGFVQMILRQFGYNRVPRDSKDQYTWNELVSVSDKDAIQPADLLFFGHVTSAHMPHSPTITHVAISLGENQYIHATMKERPCIHISTLQDTPWNVQKSAQEHSFFAIKRLRTISYTT